MSHVSCHLGTALMLLLTGPLLAAEPTVWRSGWASMAKPEETIACAREIGFNALVFHGPVERMRQWSAMTKAAGIESYYWFSPIVPEKDADLTLLAQVMSAEDDAALQNLRAAKDPKKEYCRRHPDMPRERALQEFSRDTLVETINEISRHARGVRPGIKVTIHVYPTFLPEPVYGWRLDVDTCCETVAWFFEPYWSVDKIADHTRRVTQRPGSPFAGARGVPFFGLYVGRPDSDKPPERRTEKTPDPFVLPLPRKTHEV